MNFKAAKLKDQLKLAAQKVKDKGGEGAAYLTTKGKTSPAQDFGPPASDVVRRKMEDMVTTMFSVDGLEALGSLGGSSRPSLDNARSASHRWSATSRMAMTSLPAGPK